MEDQTVRGYDRGKEKRMVHKDLLWVGILFLILLIVCNGKYLLLNNEYQTYLETSLTPDELQITMEEGGQQIVSYEFKGQTAYGLELDFFPLQTGEAIVDVSGKGVAQQYVLKVLPNHAIRDENSLNFSGYRIDLIAITTFILLLTAILWRGFFAAKKKFHYSYQTMFYSGLGIWMTIVSVIQIISMFLVLSDPANFTMYNFYYLLSNTGISFMMFSLPFVLAFAIFMLFSNLTLIKRESKRWQNALGIIIGVIMVIGEVLMLYLESRDYSGSETQLKIIDCAIDIFCAVFVLMECLLIGAIICGLMAAFHTPSYDQDYIIILGCTIKKDGSLYPLIQGRVDRAIAFYRKQIELKGRAPILLPSGGKGSDEMISEGAAMARYLKEQGIPEEHILPETAAANTLQNIKFSKELIEKREAESKAGNKPVKVSFSTTKYHIFRSGILSHQADLDADGMGSATKWYFWPNAFLRELIGLISYKKIVVGILILICIAFYIVTELVLLN